MNYHFNKQRGPLSSNQIQESKNFDELLKSYQNLKIPFYKTKFFWGASSLVFTAIISLFLLPHFFKSETKTSTAFIQPPFTQLAKNQDYFLIDNERDTTIIYKTGSIIHIPAHSLIDEKGNKINGSVKINYEEFHNQQEIFLSGIPMNYDSAGKQYTFESAGMLAITASQDNKTLHIKKDKEWKINMVADNKNPDFKLYYLDTINRKWVTLNESVENNLIVDSFISENNSSQPMPPTRTDISANLIKPVLPVRMDKQLPAFTIEVDKEEFPEIALYTGTKFQVTDKTKYDSEKAKIEWEDVQLKKKGNNLYEVTFIKGDSTFRLDATAVLSEEDYSKASKLYEQKYAAYENALAEKTKKEKQAKQENERLAAEIESRIQDELKRQQERVQKYEASLSKSDLIYRTFSIENFGVYNCDCPRNMPSQRSVIATFFNESTQPLSIQRVYLVEKNRKILYNYAVQNSKCADFKFDGDKVNAIWAVTIDDKLAIISPESFTRQIANQQKSISFQCELIDQKFKSTEEVKNFLRL